MRHKFLPYTEKQDGRKKLTAEQIEEIKSKYAQGRTQKSLAKEYGVTRPAIGYHVNEGIKIATRERMKKNWRSYHRTGKDWNETQKRYRDKKLRLGLIIRVA